MTAQSSESVREWPGDYVRTALQFFALDRAGKRAFLPKKFPENFSEITFHMQDADARFANPFEFMGLFAADCCRTAAFSDVNEQQEHLLFEFSSLLFDLARRGERARLWSLKKEQHEAWDAVAKLAKLVLKSFQSDVSAPTITCVELLNEYSYNSYSSVVGRATRG